MSVLYIVASTAVKTAAWAVDRYILGESSACPRQKGPAKTESAKLPLEEKQCDKSPLLDKMADWAKRHDILNGKPVETDTVEKSDTPPPASSPTLIDRIKEIIKEKIETRPGPPSGPARG